jgi:hypothetical protein
MTQNPYAQPPGFDTSMSAPARTSVAAILSLVCALVCFIPGLSILAIILGIAALMMISSSQGRVTGKGLAISGIFIGVLVTLLWGAAVYGAKQLNQMFGQQFMGNATTFFQAVEAKNYSQARTLLNTPTNQQAPSDADFDAFVAAYQAEVGTFKSMPDGLFSLLGSYSKLQGFNLQASPGQVPIPTEFSNGIAVVWLELPPGMNPGSTPTKSSIPIVNIGVLSRNGKSIWLIPRPGAPSTSPTAPPAGNAGHTPPTSPPPPPAGNGG